MIIIPYVCGARLLTVQSARSAVERGDSYIRF